MHSAKPIRAVVFSALLLGSCGFTALQAAVVYEDKFGNSTGSDKTLNTVGWLAYRGPTATAITAGGTGSIYIPASVGNPNTDGGGFLAFNQIPADNYIAYETVSAINPAAGSLTFSWQQLASVAGAAETRLLIQIGGQWVASSQTFTPAVGPLTDFNSAANAGAFTQSFAFTTAAASWRDVTFTAGSTLSMSGTNRVTDLSAGNITAVGYYYVASGTVVSMRMDNLVVNQIPEPGMALPLLAGLALLGKRRR